MAGKDEEKQKQDAERIFRGADRDSHSIFAGALHKLGKMTGLSAGHDDRADDPAEKWGRIVGRTLGFAFLILLVINLFTGKIF